MKVAEEEEVYEKSFLRSGPRWFESSSIEMSCMHRIGHRLHFCVCAMARHGPAKKILLALKDSSLSPFYI